MSSSDWLATYALILSVLSILTSVYLYQKDRGHVRTWAILNYGDPAEGHRPVLEIHAVNIGRRPILLDWLLFDFPRTGRRGIQIADKIPLKLDEGERLDRTLRPTDPELFDDAYDYATAIYVGDTLGRVYRVTDAKKLLRDYQRIYAKEIEEWKSV